MQTPLTNTNGAHDVLHGYVGHGLAIQKQMWDQRGQINGNSGASPCIIYITGERHDGAAPGNGSATVTTLLPPDFHGATAGKHARIDGSAWHTASFYPSWEVNIDWLSDNSLPVVYKISHLTISRMSKMCVYRQIFVIWAPAVDDASGRCSLLCSVLNCKINTAWWPSRGTPM